MARFRGSRKGVRRGFEGYPVSSPRLTPLYFKGICKIGEVAFIGISYITPMLGVCRTIANGRMERGRTSFV
jgi:hypothetical protein